MKEVKSISLVALPGLLVLFWFLTACSSDHKKHQILVKELEYSLKSELIDIWYPQCIDTINGGFLSNYTYNWKAEGPQRKMLVTQSRHVWTSSQAAMFFDDKSYAAIATEGFHFLKTRMWDSIYGGFYMLRNTQGDTCNNSYRDTKRAYGTAFAIFALASYYELSKDTSALNLAIKSFQWLNKYQHDPVYGGYYDFVTRDGSFPDEKNTSLKGQDLIKARWKDQNSSIHLLEAFTSLYKIWPDSVLKEHLSEMLYVIRDSIIDERGYLNLFLERDWTPVSYRDSSRWVRQANYFFDHVSFGHDLEIAYLMLEASEALQLKSDTVTLRIARKMVDHALHNGWDYKNGGFYDRGYYFATSDSITIISNAKTWWVQAEGLNALLLMSKLFPEDTRYFAAFQKQWKYIKKYMIDHKHGGWIQEGIDYSPELKKDPKATDWKVNYHDSRALMNCIRMLKAG